MKQALDYALDLRKGGRVSAQTPILCYVLGSTIEASSTSELTMGETRVIPRRYDAVMKQAHARTFRLLERLKSSKAMQLNDAELAEVMDQNELELSPALVEADSEAGSSTAVRADVALAS